MLPDFAAIWSTLHLSSGQKAMKKPIIKTLPWLLLLLCIAMAITWQWSYSASARNASLETYVHGHQYDLSARAGELSLEIREGYPTSRGGLYSPPGKVFTISTRNEYRSCAGVFGYYRSPPQFAYQFFLFFPISWLVIVFAGSSLGAFRLTWRQRCRRIAHACSKCGYDLTGNESGACPECGQKLPGVNSASDLLSRSRIDPGLIWP